MIFEIILAKIIEEFSVSGVGQFFEISKRSHVIIHSNGKAVSILEFLLNSKKISQTSIKLYSHSIYSTMMKIFQEK